MSPRRTLNRHDERTTWIQMSFFYQLVVVDSQAFPKLREDCTHMYTRLFLFENLKGMRAHNVVLQSANQQSESWDETYLILISYVRIFPHPNQNQISGITWISCRSSAPRTSWPMTTVAMALAKALPRRKPAMSRSRPLWESGKEMVGGN